MQYKRVPKMLPQVARELSVDAIVEGSVRHEGNRVRITAELIAGRTDEHLWTETYDRDLRDVLTLQSEVAAAIAAEIRAKLHTSLEPLAASVQSFAQGDASKNTADPRYLLVRRAGSPERNY